ncbi:MAG: UvrD-helicase domain-containing protein [Dehalococcoidia bacterium]|nr:UvrD-helicase domain-containing protein [Dehalococcoidia bacterium]
MSDPVRDRIIGIAEGSFTETIYAGAGAGTGKTGALVERIANLVTQGGVKPLNIAAITFTDAAASELRRRVREELEKKLADAREENAEADLEALSTALRSLDSGYLGTIHSFALSLLREQPLDIGLPPVFEVLDPVQGDALFDAEWDEWLGDALTRPAFAAAVIDAQRLGLRSPLAALRDLAGELHENYDIVERFGELKAPTQSVKPADYLTSIRSDLAAALDLRAYCTNPDDRLLDHLDNTIALAVSWIDEALESGLDEESVLALTQLPKLSATVGRAPDWSPLASGDSSLEEARALLKEAQGRLESGRQSFGESTVVPLVNEVASMVLSYADKRRTRGQLEFQDLLVLSCRLLAESDSAKEYFQARYTHVLIDEFQDTDPLQLKLAILLTDRDGAGAPTPGSLFVVGDEKQSIYRFRRADLTQLQGLISSLGAIQLSLSKNYRSNPEILDWVNAVFEPWMNGPGGSSRNPNQAQYVPLEPGKSDQGGPSTDKPRVMMMGAPSTGDVTDARDAEAADLAQLSLGIGAGDWTLVGRNGHEYQSSFRDLCVLIPRRTALPNLEAAFKDHGVPYVLEGQAAIFETQTFHELGNNFAAIDDPTDQVAIVAALKSNAWGCSDQDLFEWASLDRKFEYSRVRTQPDDFHEDSGVHRVATALAGLAEFHDKRQQHSTPFLVEEFIRERRLREVAALMDPSGEREQLMDMFIEMSRQLQHSGTGSLRELVRWLSRQAEAGVRVAEGALANSEVNAVRVMTIYAAKGLEFPIVALSGLQVPASAPKGNSITKEKNGQPIMAVRLGARGLGLATGDYDNHATVEKEADVAEHARLAYVGATRAREHLVVSVHRSSSDKSTLAVTISEYAEANPGLWQQFDIEQGTGPGREDGLRRDEDPDAARPGEFSQGERASWIQVATGAISAASRRGYVTPSRLADHTMFDAPPPAKPDDAAESTEWNTARRGRGGTDVGSAVHAVLQDIDFDDPSALNDLVRLSADAYSMPGQQENIARLVRNVLECPVVAGATGENTWKEAWVAAEISDGVEVEGFIDLIVRNADNTMTIVDYKTDQVSGEKLIERAKGYESQLAGYALVVEKLGMMVREAVLVFADGGPGGRAYEHTIANLDAAKTAAMSKILHEIG